MSEQIEICGGCEGKGFSTFQQSYDGQTGAYDYEDVVCPLCEGSGRTMRVTTVKVVPYTPDKIKEGTYQ